MLKEKTARGIAEVPKVIGIHLPPRRRGCTTRRAGSRVPQSHDFVGPPEKHAAQLAREVGRAMVAGEAQRRWILVNVKHEVGHPLPPVVEDDDGAHAVVPLLRGDFEWEVRHVVAGHDGHGEERAAEGGRRKGGGRAERERGKDDEGTAGSWG